LDITKTLVVTNYLVLSNVRPWIQIKSTQMKRNMNKCLDYRESVSKTDEEVISYMNQLGISSVSELQRLEKERRNHVKREIKKIKGIPLDS